MRAVAATRPKQMPTICTMPSAISSLRSKFHRTAPAVAWTELDASCFNLNMVMSAAGLDYGAIRHRLREVKPVPIFRSPSQTKLDFGLPIATFSGDRPPLIALSPSLPRPHGPPFSEYRRGNAAVGAGAGGLHRQLLPSDRAARRHRPVARRQNRVHHGADPRPHPWRPVSGVRILRHGADRPRPSRAAAG